MRVLITGGRDYNDQYALEYFLDDLHKNKCFKTLIHGGASGADRLAGNWAISREIEVEECPANWEKHGKSAGPIRNQEMLDKNPDLLIAFPGGRGTSDMVKRAKKSGLEIIFYE